MSKPTWIVFEGIDGSGKTTQAKLLNEYLNRNGVKSLYRHVFDTGAGKLLRAMFIDNTFSNTVEILILCAARQALLDEVADLGEGYDVIIIDRFFMSILAMQGIGESDINLIKYIQENICSGKDKPVVFYMNTTPEDCKNRLVSRSIRDRIEGKDVEFHRKVSNRYLTLLRDEENVYQFEGGGDIRQIHRDIADQASRVLGIAKGATWNP